MHAKHAHAHAHTHARKRTRARTQARRHAIPHATITARVSAVAQKPGSVGAQSRAAHTHGCCACAVEPSARGGTAEDGRRANRIENWVEPLSLWR